ncbi:MAG: hypothetical protein IPJ65_34345 [Archangiaceae bacterium]|nr:hypothetical protein [Archangiaceae bacterium]
MKTTTLEQKTDAARARLNEVLDAIDSRRHALKSPQTALAAPATRVTGVLKRLALPLGAALGGVAAIAASLFLRKRRSVFHPRPVLAPAAKVLQSAGISMLSYGLAETVKAGVKLGAR